MTNVHYSLLYGFTGGPVILVIFLFVEICMTTQIIQTLYIYVTGCSVNLESKSKGEMYSAYYLFPMHQKTKQNI